jgi:peptide/nickel transport system substrate-binding protein
MRSRRTAATILFSVLLFACLLANCSKEGESKPFVAVLESPPRTLDQLVGNDASSERIRQLVYNSLVRKDEKFDYVGELATNIVRADDGLSYTFTLRDGVKFHNGKAFTSADVKYTFETLLRSDSPKATDFFEGVTAERKLYENGYVTAIDTPDERTVVVRLRSPWLNLLPNCVAFGIVPEGSTPEERLRQPLGTGFYKFAGKDASQEIYDFEAFEDYWGGAPAIKRLRVRVILDANTLQAELQSGGADIAVVGNLQPEDYEVLGQLNGLQVKQFPGANVVYLNFNAQDEVLKDAGVRSAIAYGVNRELIVKELLRGQAKVANSILPEESWAYHQGQTYAYDPEAAKRTLQEAGYTGAKALTKPISFKVNGGSAPTLRYAAIIENSLRGVGIPVSIDAMEFNTLQQQQQQGQFQLTTGRWVGGNQDPIFLRNLFLTGANFNRGRYSNPDLDKILEEVARTYDRTRASDLYAQAQDIISREVPMFPLWYAAQMVVARKNVANINVDMSGDWRFMRDLTVEK